MREPIRDRERLLHIISAADFVIENTREVEFEKFISDRMLYGAVIYHTMVIGEACYKLSRKFTETYTDTPWNDISGMRHHIVHGYYKVDNNVIWNIIRNDIPQLRQRVQQYLDEIDWSNWEEQMKNL